MNKKGRMALIATLALLAAAVGVAASQATPVGSGAPAVVAYQGEVRVEGAPHNGNGYFKFAIVNEAGDTTYWANVGTSSGGDEPDTAVPLAVSDGLFSVLLGDTTLDGMTQPLTAEVFGEPDLYLRVWFSTSGANGTFSQLAPDTRIAAVPYALQAQEAANAGTVDGYEGASLEESAEIDADLTAHTNITGAHHTRYTDGEAWAAVSANDGAGSGLDADMVDGYEGGALEESAEIDADLTAHTNVTGAHHTRYTDGEAWAAVSANDGAGSGLDADTVDGLHASQLGGGYQNIVVVAKSGGDYTSVQGAIDSITDAAADNAYLVWVAPGVYTETVNMVPFVHLQGAGQEVTILSSTISGSGGWPKKATLTVASDTSLRDLTVDSGGAGVESIALLATAGTTRTLVADVTVRAQGGSTHNYAVYLENSGTGATLQQVTAVAENGSDQNAGLYNRDGVRAVLHGGSFTGHGGTQARGILNFGMLEVDGITALGEGGSSENAGMKNVFGTVMVHGGSFTARGGIRARGLYNNNHATLEAEGVTTMAEGGSTSNYGLSNEDYVTATLRGGSFTGRGGTDAAGISNRYGNATLDADGVTALAEEGIDLNCGLATSNEATLRGGSFTGRGGTDARGICSTYNSDALAAEGVTALAEDGTTSNYGLYKLSGGLLWLRGGSFTGRGGVSAAGIYGPGGVNTDGVSALGEGGSGENYGLRASGAALRGGSFTGVGGASAVGIWTDNWLEADGVTADAKNGTSSSYGLHNATGHVEVRSSTLSGHTNGLYQNGGTVYIAVSQVHIWLVEGGGTLTCFQTWNDFFLPHYCP